MRIILEGPDNSGKTTLAQMLVKKSQPPITYFHPGGRPKGLIGETACMQEQFAMLQSYSNIVIDRVTCISQRVYSPDAELNDSRMAQLKRLMTLDPVVIYCRPSNDRLMRFQDFTWREGETEEFKQEIIRGQHTFIERYDHFMQDVPNISYDFDDPMGEVIRKKLIKAVNGSAVDEDWFLNLMHYRVTP